MSEGSIIETALKMFFNFEINIDRLRKESINRGKISRGSAGVDFSDENRDDAGNVIINLKFN
jgi:hypothetical protein